MEVGKVCQQPLEMQEAFEKPSQVFLKSHNFAVSLSGAGPPAKAPGLEYPLVPRGEVLPH